MSRQVRNITIGLIDGLTIPFALAAGLSNVWTSSRTVFSSCFAVIIAWSVTMTIGAYSSAKKHEPGNEWQSALLIGAGYILGGLISTLPFYFIGVPGQALKYSAVITMTMLLIAGFTESKVNHANAWAGAARVAVTGAVAGAAAYYVAGLFR